MSAYLVARFSVRDSDALATYSQSAGPLVAEHGGKLLFKGNADHFLNGDDPRPGIAVFEFPSKQQLDTFYKSDAYTALKEIREKGADMILSAHD